MGIRRIEVAPVPPISNNTTAIPAVILIVNLFLFIIDIDFLNHKIGYKIYYRSSNNHTHYCKVLVHLNIFTLTLQNNPRQIYGMFAKQTIQDRGYHGEKNYKSIFMMNPLSLFLKMIKFVLSYWYRKKFFIVIS